MSASTPVPSTQPYFVRALHEWCTDNGFTPYMSVKVDGSVRVPMAYVQEGEIVLNTSYDATSHLQIDNESVHFQARFGGVMHDILIPIGRIQAVFARENGQGMGFAVIDDALDEAFDEAFDAQADTELDANASAPEQDLPNDASSAEPAASVARIAPAPQADVPVQTQEPVLEAASASAEVAPQRAPLSAVPSTDASTTPTDEPPPAPTGAGKKRPALRLVK